MKKAVIVGVLSVLGVAWAGASWYSGRLGEAYLRQIITQGNADWKIVGESAGFAIESEVISFDRGVFSSTMRYRMKFVTPVEGGGQSTIPAIEFVGHIDHGPFPLSSLADGDLRPAMIEGSSELQETPFVKGWFAATKGVAPVLESSRLSYGEVSESRFSLAPMEFLADGVRVQLSGVSGVSTVDTRKKASELSVRIDSVRLNHVSKPSGLTGIALQGVTLVSNYGPGKDDVVLGTQALGFKTLEMTVAAQPAVTVQASSLTLSLVESDAGFDHRTLLDVGMVNAWGQDVVAAKLAMQMKKLNMDALQALSQIDLLASIRIWQGAIQGRLPQFSSDDLLVLVSGFDQVSTGSAQVSVGPLQLHTVNGSSSVNVDMTLTRPTIADPDVMGMAQLRRLSADIALSQASLVDLIVFSGRFIGHAPEAARKIIEPRVATIVSKVRGAGVAKVENGNVLSSISYADGVFDINGTKMSQEQFAQLLTSRAWLALD